MNELALFAGAGGGILAAELLGDRTVCAVEIDGYGAAILAQRQNDGLIPVFPIWSDVRTFDGEPWRGIVDCVSGGFPCQDISVAGPGLGLEGERSGLWREFARIVREVEPAVVRVENSPMLASRGLARVLADLSEMGFDAEWDVVSAADLGAPHLRERLWLVASNAHRLRELQRERCQRYERRWARHSSDAYADAGGSRLQAPGAQQTRAHWRDTGGGIASGGGWPAEPGLVRMVHGVPHRVDRIKCLGNAQVPRVAAAAFSALQAEFK